MCIEKREEALFQRWAKRRTGFVRDGVVNPSAYEKSETKVLFILKEVNDPGPDGGGWDLRDFISSGARSQSWNTVTRWVQGIRALPSRLAWRRIANVTEKDRQNELRSIAAMNLKKYPGGHTTNVGELWEIAGEDSSFIREQFELYSADIAVCCGSAVGHIYREYLQPSDAGEWGICTNGVEYLEREPGKFVIAYSHPAARVSGNLLHYGLIDAIHEIRAMLAS